jgi:23S rRNA (guanosine2251-2'-O)-methyltransferase
MQRRPQKNRRLSLNNGVLKNKILKELFVVGKNSILEIFDTKYQDFETVILPTNFNSNKIKEIEDLSRKYHITVLRDTGLIDYAKNNLSIDSSGVIVLLKRRMENYYSLSDLRSSLQTMESCTVVALPEVDYEHNIGAMIRTSLALNTDFLLVPNSQQKVFSSTVTKISMGYNFVLPVVQENFLLAITELKKMGFQIVGLDMGGENIINFSYNPKVCFVLGNEGKGLSEPVLRKCDNIISIPMNDVVESLNVSTSLGMVLYDRMSKLNK